MISYTDLQNGYHALRSRAQARKQALQKDLQDGKRISDADEAWLDADANLVDEERALEHLDGVANLTEAIALLPENLQMATNNLISGASCLVDWRIY